MGSVMSAQSAEMGDRFPSLPGSLPEVGWCRFLALWLPCPEVIWLVKPLPRTLQRTCTSIRAAVGNGFIRVGLCSPGWPPKPPASASHVMEVFDVFTNGWSVCLFLCMCGSTVWRSEDHWQGSFLSCHHAQDPGDKLRSLSIVGSAFTY